MDEALEIYRGMHQKLVDMIQRLIGGVNPQEMQGRQSTPSNAPRRMANNFGLQIAIVDPAPQRSYRIVP